MTFKVTYMSFLTRVFLLSISCYGNLKRNLLTDTLQTIGYIVYSIISMVRVYKPLKLYVLSYF